MSKNADFFPSLHPSCEQNPPLHQKLNQKERGRKSPKKLGGGKVPHSKPGLAGIERDRQEFVSKPNYAQKNIPFGDGKTSAETTSAENSIDLPQSRVRKIKSWGVHIKTALAARRRGWRSPITGNPRLPRDCADSLMLRPHLQKKGNCSVRGRAWYKVGCPSIIVFPLLHQRQNENKEKGPAKKE